MRETVSKMVAELLSKFRAAKTGDYVNSSCGCIFYASAPGHFRHVNLCLKHVITKTARALLSDGGSPATEAIGHSRR